MMKLASPVLRRRDFAFYQTISRHRVVCHIDPSNGRSSQVDYKRLLPPFLTALV